MKKISRRNFLKVSGAMAAAGALAALRIFGVYLQVFGSLLTTGLGLISSGLVLLLTVGIWNKLKLKTEKCHE